MIEVRKVVCYFFLTHILKANRKFFIADDDPDDQELFIDALHEINELFECVTATDGTEALETLSSHLFVPDLIFLDLNMPKMDGRECLSEIKKDAFLKEIPVIIYSTSSEKKDIMDVMQSGASYYLQKPSRYEELSRALLKIIFFDWKKLPAKSARF